MCKSFSVLFACYLARMNISLYLRSMKLITGQYEEIRFEGARGEGQGAREAMKEGFALAFPS